MDNYTTNVGCDDIVFTKPWTRWFAWYPVRVNGNIIWLKFVYRKEKRHTYVNCDDWVEHQYGTLFDVLK